MTFHIREFKLASQAPFQQALTPYTIDTVRVQGPARLLLRQRFGTEMRNFEPVLPQGLQAMMRIGMATHIGTRRRNEDSSVALMSHFGDDLNAVPVILLAVADGLGGNADGHIASGLAIQTLTERVVKHMAAFGEGISGAELTAESVEALLIEAITIAHHQIRAGTHGGSTTLTCALIIDRAAYVAHVGDCRAYMLNTGWTGLEIITRDHRRERQVEGITLGANMRHKRAHIVTRVLGRSVHSEVDLTRRNLVNGSRLLLCSNGVWEHVTPESIFTAIRQTDQPQESCDALIRQALANAADDDMTAVLVDMPN